MIKQLKILHIFGKMDRGGAEMRAMDMMEKLQGPDSLRSVLFDFVSLSGQDGDLDPKIQSLGGRVFPIKLNWLFPWRFYRLLRREKYDVVHSHVQLFSGFLLLLAAWANVPVRLAHLHTTGSRHGLSLRRRLQDKLMIHWLYQYATSLVAVSRGALENFTRQAPCFNGDDRLRMIYDGVNVDHFLSVRFGRDIFEELKLPRSARILIHVGRTNPVKNHEKIIGVFQKLCDIDSSLHLVLVGASEPERKKFLEEMIREKGLSGKVTLLGARTDVHHLLNQAQLMIFPSHYEGLPGAVLEALSLGVPVLASDLPGCRELAEHFPWIQILPVELSDDQWSKQAALILQGSAPEAERALQILKSSPFNLENTLKDWMRLWSHVLSADGASSRDR